MAASSYSLIPGRASRSRASTARSQNSAPIRPSTMHASEVCDPACCGNVVVHLREQRRFEFRLSRENKECLPRCRVVGKVLHFAAHAWHAVDQQRREISLLHSCSHDSITTCKFGLRKVGIEIFVVHHTPVCFMVMLTSCHLSFTFFIGRCPSDVLIQEERLMICYTTTFLAVPGFEKEVMTILREHVKHSKKEQGLIASQAYRSETEPRRFFIYHVFTDSADNDVRRATKFYGGS